MSDREKELLKVIENITENNKYLFDKLNANINERLERIATAAMQGCIPMFGNISFPSIEAANHAIAHHSVSLARALIAEIDREKDQPHE